MVILPQTKRSTGQTISKLDEQERTVIKKAIPDTGKTIKSFKQRDLEQKKQISLYEQRQREFQADQERKRKKSELESVKRFEQALQTRPRGQLGYDRRLEEINKWIERNQPVLSDPALRSRVQRLISSEKSRISRIGEKEYQSAISNLPIIDETIKPQPKQIMAMGGTAQPSETFIEKSEALDKWIEKYRGVLERPENYQRALSKIKSVRSKLSSKIKSAYDPLIEDLKNREDVEVQKVNGPDDIPRGSAHSFGITPGDTITITKNWANYQLARLNDATKERNSILVVLFDREQAIFMSVTGRGIETITELKGNVNKKAVDETVKNNFYQEIVQTTKELNETKKPSGVVFASPAFWQEYIKKYVEGFKPIYTTISDVEKTAVRELVGRPELQKLLKNNRAALEIQYTEEIMHALAHDKLAYGDKDVREAVEQANVKTVFLSQTRIHKEREEGTFEKTEQLLRQAESAGAGVHIMSATQSCRELDGLGGLVVILRW